MIFIDLICTLLELITAAMQSKFMLWVLIIFVAVIATLFIVSSPAIQHG